jgi:hypothetical protein
MLGQLFFGRGCWGWRWGRRCQKIVVDVDVGGVKVSVVVVVVVIARVRVTGVMVVGTKCPETLLLVEIPFLPEGIVSHVFPLCIIILTLAFGAF